MNVYHELLELLCPRQEQMPPVLFGTLSGVEPLEVTVGGKTVRKGLFCDKNAVFHVEQIGETVALLPCEGGFLILFRVRRGET